MDFTQRFIEAKKRYDASRAAVDRRLEERVKSGAPPNGEDDRLFREKDAAFGCYHELREEIANLALAAGFVVGEPYYSEQDRLCETVFKGLAGEAQ